MKAPGWIIIAAAIIITGCSGPNASFRSAPSGYYRVHGMVGRPGLVKCDSSEKTLMTIIKDAGGFTIQSYLRKIRVSYAGNKNYFNGRKILNGESEDPLLACGSTIEVMDNFF